MPRKKKLQTREQAELVSAFNSGADINPSARSPDMPPTGSKEPWIYILGEAPGENEDRQKEQFVGISGRLIRKQFGPQIQPYLRWNNVVRTRPVSETGANRAPTPEEIEFYTPSLIADIEETKPKLILAVGAIPLSWCLPDIGPISVCRGRRFPVKIGTHRTWIYPVHHPSYILRVENGMDQDVPGLEWKRAWLRDVQKAISDTKTIQPPEVLSIKELRGDFQVLTRIQEIQAALEQLEGQEASIDIETNATRPYGEDARIISIAIATGNEVVAFPYQTKDGFFGQSSQKNIARFVTKFLCAGPARIAYNSSFEIEWLTYFLGREVARANWVDPMAMAFVLDSRKLGHGLDFMFRLEFGFSVKALSKLDVSKLDDAPLEEVLEYNALDARAALFLSKRLHERVVAADRTTIFEDHNRRIPALVLTQIKGVPVDQNRVVGFQIKLAEEKREIEEKIQVDPEVVRFAAAQGKEFNPRSNPQLVALFRDQLNRKEGQRGRKYSTDEDALSQIKLPIAKMILEMRGITKLKSTYIDSLVPGKMVWPDGLVHPQYTSLYVVTGRLSSRDINIQNQPSRKHKEIRSVVVAPKGFVLVAIDFAQIEVKVLGMHSGDKFLVKAIKDGWDFHEHWTKEVVKTAPSQFERLAEKDFKALRSRMKNELVFPLFYGSQPPALSARLEIPLPKAERLYHDFWKMFPEVRIWQGKTMQTYQRQHYVKGLSGRATPAPLKQDAILNYPIQGDASDIAVDAWVRLSKKADEIPHLQPLLGVHDDLTFLIPESELENLLEVIVSVMLSPTYSWASSVPLEVEVSIGNDWHKMEPIGKFRSNT